MHLSHYDSILVSSVYFSGPAVSFLSYQAIFHPICISKLLFFIFFWVYVPIKFNSMNQFWGLQKFSSVLLVLFTLWDVLFVFCYALFSFLFNMFLFSCALVLCGVFFDCSMLICYMDFVAFYFILVMLGWLHSLYYCYRGWVTFIQFNQYLLNAFYVPGTVLNAKYTALNKTDKYPCPHGAYIIVEEGDHKQNK